MTMVIAALESTAGASKRENGGKYTLPPAAVAAILKELPNPAILICAPESPLARMAKAENIPYLTGRRRDLPRLWLWQRSHLWLQILALDAPAIKLANWFNKVRKKNTTHLNAAFFGHAPDQTDLKLLKNFRHCLCGSETIFRTMETLLAQNPKKFYPLPLELCHPGINLYAYKQKKSARSPERFVFGMAESRLPDSGALLAVRAMAAIWQREGLPPWELRMFGGGERLEEILAEAENLGVASRLAILDDQSLPEVLQHCDAWLAPGKSGFEDPETLLAGFGANIPVIASRSRIHEEYLENASSEVALRVNISNPQQLAQAMISLMLDSALRDRLTRNGAAFAESISSLATAKKISQLMESWLGE